MPQHRGPPFVRLLPTHRNFDQFLFLLRIPEPLAKIFLELNSLFLQENDRLPHAHRGQKTIVPWIGQFPNHLRTDFVRFEVAPEPNMRVQQQFHSVLPGFFSSTSSGSRAPSQSDSSPIGPTISPRITAVPAPPPSRIFLTALAGAISAMGWPNRLTRIGSPVLRTRSRTARHVALNCEIPICFMAH